MVGCCSDVTSPGGTQDATLALDAAACEAVDTSGQIGETLGLSEQLRDALWRVDSAAIAPVDAHGGLIVAGMGGSSVGGRLAAGALGPRLRRPLALAMGYDIPPWIGRETLVLCVELLRLDGGDARDVRRREGRRSAAPGLDDRRRARAARARRRRAGDPAARRLPAARGGRLRARDRARGGRAVRRGAVAARRGRGARPRWPPSWRASGAPTAPRTARPSGSRARCTARSR